MQPSIIARFVLLHLNFYIIDEHLSTVTSFKASRKDLKLNDRISLNKELNSLCNIMNGIKITIIVLQLLKYMMAVSFARII